MQNKLAVLVLICLLPLASWAYENNVPQQGQPTSFSLIFEGTQPEESELQQILVILHGVNDMLPQFAGSYSCTDEFPRREADTSKSGEDHAEKGKFARGQPARSCAD
jgi:hypothetical protein